MRVDKRGEKDEAMRFIFQDGKKFVVRYRNNKTGFRFEKRYVTLAEAQEARDNAIRGQSIIQNGDGSRQSSANV